MPTRTTLSKARFSAVAVAGTTGLMLAFLAAGWATATSAAAVDDPTRPDARVTHGPSCHAGGIVVEVTAGSSPYAARLATTRQPAGEDAADLEPGQTVVLRTGDVAWGETIDSRVEYTPLDASGTAHVDELDNFSFTRPTEEDCAAIAGPLASGLPAPLPVGVPASDAGTPGSHRDGPPALEPAGSVPAPVGELDPHGGSAAEEPGTEVPGSAQGTSGRAVDVDLEVAAQQVPGAAREVATAWPLISAASSLVVTTGALFVLVCRRWGSARGRFPIGSA